MHPTSLPKDLSAGPKKAEKVDGKKFGNFPPVQGLNTSLYQRLSYKLIGIFCKRNSLSCKWTSDSRNVSVNTNRTAKQCRMSALSFKNSVPSHKNCGENRIANRGCLAKEGATSALRVELL